MVAVGIDFGTTNCAVACWNGKPYTLPLGDNRPFRWAFPGFEYLFPSVFAVKEAERLFGWEAKAALSDQEPVKRLLTGMDRMTVGDRVYSSRHVAALLFGAMKERARLCDVDITSAVVTVPSNATGMARFRTREAAGMAGIRVQALINEPTAAAMAYLHAIPDAELVMVYDWGGGTLDVTVLEFQNGIYQERASFGILGLGGIEVDGRLADVVRKRLAPGPELTGRADLEFRSELERLKIALSFAEDLDSEVVFSLADGREAGITRRDFQKSIRLLIDKTLEPVEKCLEAAGIEAVDLDAVLMVGGGSFIPAVRERLTDFLDTEPVSQDAFNPMTIVAEGAAMAAAALNGEADIAFSVISNHALATRVKDASNKASLSEVIPRGVELPYRASKRYTPNKDYADFLKVQVWEGNPELPIEDSENVQLAELTLIPDEPRPRSESEFELEYQYDIDGVVTVTATHLISGRILLKDKADFFSGSATEIDPEIADVRETFEAPAPPAAGESPRAAARFSDRPEPVSEEVPAKFIPRRRPAPSVVTSRQETLVVDGSNLACEGQDLRRGGQPSYARLQAAVDRLSDLYPAARVIVVVDASLRHKLPPDEREEFEVDCAEGRVVVTPAGTVGAGDALVLTIAASESAIVVSNDSYRDHQHNHPWLRESNRMLGASPVGSNWFFVPRVPPGLADPAARRGPAVEVPKDVADARWRRRQP